MSACLKHETKANICHKYVISLPNLAPPLTKVITLAKNVTRAAIKKKVALVYWVAYENAANMKYASLHSLLSSNMFGEEFHKVTAKVTVTEMSRMMS